MAPELDAPVAAVDCGTNSTRLLVVGGLGEPIDRRMRITRLGAGVDATGMLDPRAVDRTVDALMEYRRVMDALGVARVRAVATSATRDAGNSEEFFVRAESAIGVRPELLSGEDEGLLSFRGATAHLPREAVGPGPILVVDIGGGSTELVVGRGDGDSREVKAASLDVGCVRVAERFFAHDPPDEQEMTEARSHVRREVSAAKRRLFGVDPGGTLVGLAGTVSTVAALEHGVSRYSREAVHHVVIDRSRVSHWLGVLASEDSAARLRRPGMAAGREDVITGGVLVLDEVMDCFESKSCLVSEDDILDGIALSLTETNGD
jgi:exopolyphosphatase/guanosine-5'-triphosphate,3'-diphosphate pyrophosphatase